jgi:hypothetical protein
MIYISSISSKCLASAQIYVYGMHPHSILHCFGVRLSNGTSDVVVRSAVVGPSYKTVHQVAHVTIKFFILNYTMPALEFGSDALVLVSGANDFIAIHVIRSLLENGYRVRGTVRSTAKIPHLKTTFASYGDRLELIVVPDITVVCSVLYL